jgi:fused signal recognition particle receptor
VSLLRSAFSKLKSGLTRARESFAAPIRSLLLGRRLDEDLIEELETRLLAADVGVAATTRIITAIRTDFRAGRIETGDQVLEHLKGDLKGLWPDEDRSLHRATDGPTVVLVVGVNGAGKTTSIAKLARLYAQNGDSVLLAAGDTFRAGAVRQLEIWAERLGVDLIKGQQDGDPAAVAFDACDAALGRGVDVLIIDTAGRLHNQDALMRQLTKIRDIIARKIPGAPHETLLVLDATTGQNAVNQAREFDAAIDLSGILLAKLDGTAKGGVVIAVHEATHVPVKLVGVGETPEDLQPFEPGAFVDALFEAGD